MSRRCSLFPHRHSPAPETEAETLEIQEEFVIVSSSRLIIYKPVILSSSVIRLLNGFIFELSRLCQLMSVDYVSTYPEMVTKSANTVQRLGDTYSRQRYSVGYLPVPHLPLSDRTWILFKVEYRS